MEVTIHGAPFWYEVDGIASLSPYGYYAVPYVYGDLDCYDDEPVACGPEPGPRPCPWDLTDVCPF